MPNVPAAAHEAACPASPTALARLTRGLAVACLVALIALGLAWELWLAPLRPGGSWWALKVLPLTLPLAGVLKMRLYTFRWLSLLVWLYFTEGVVRATSERAPSAVLAGLQVLLSLLLFVACAAHVRHRLAAAKRRPVAGTPPTEPPPSTAAASPAPASRTRP
jgi:uncharacterized membrane protein